MLAYHCFGRGEVKCLSRLIRLPQPRTQIHLNFRTLAYAVIPANQIKMVSLNIFLRDILSRYWDVVQCSTFTATKQKNSPKQKTQN